jgi:prepilin-type N-terminal cleavage/methylation domain-containing protein
MNSPGARGFTLVEVAVALVVLAVATTAATGLMLEAAKAARDADRRERVMWAATELADSLGREPLAGAGTRVLPDGSRLTWDARRVDLIPREGGAPILRLPVVSTAGRLELGIRP